MTRIPPPCVAACLTFNMTESRDLAENWGGKNWWQTRLILKRSHISLREFWYGEVFVFIWNFDEISIIGEHVVCFFRSPQIEVTDAFYAKANLKGWAKKFVELLGTNNEIYIYIYRYTDISPYFGGSVFFPFELLLSFGISPGVQWQGLVCWQLRHCWWELCDGAYGGSMRLNAGAKGSCLTIGSRI